MTIRIQADVKTEGVSHSWFPNTGSGFGTIEFGRGNRLYFNGTEDIDELIAELVALKQEMDPPPAWCPAVTVLDDEETVYCDRDYGHPGSHHAPGPDEGSEVAWSDEMAEVAS